MHAHIKAENLIADIDKARPQLAEGVYERLCTDIANNIGEVAGLVRCHAGTEELAPAINSYYKKTRHISYKASIPEMRAILHLDTQKLRHLCVSWHVVRTGRIVEDKGADQQGGHAQELRGLSQDMHSRDSEKQGLRGAVAVDLQLLRLCTLTLTNLCTGFRRERHPGRHRPRPRPPLPVEAS